MGLRNGEMMPTEHSAIDLFCGAGGFSLGFRQAGFELLAALDNDKAARETYKFNFDLDPLGIDAAQISGVQLLNAASVKRGECTAVIGGPPCQGFSVQRRGSRKDSRNNLVKVFLDLVLELRPRFFVIENVGGLLSRHGREFHRYVEHTSASEGYRCFVEKLNAADFGIPQVRRRVLIIGERLDEGRSYFSFPLPTHTPETYTTVRLAIGSLPPPPTDGSPHPQIWNHFREARLSPTNLMRIKHIPEGGGREHLPSELALPCHTNNKKHRHLDVYGRLAWDKPAVTLTARFDSFTRGRFGHPTEHRTITLREGARLQSFPDEFRFFGNREEIARQVGNAVPPVLARAIATSLLDAISRREQNFPTPRYEPALQLSMLEESIAGRPVGGPDARRQTF
jgi:DNA (cytosine-5)-methyltransferase 1